MSKINSVILFFTLLSCDYQRILSLLHIKANQVPNNNRLRSFYCGTQPELHQLEDYDLRFGSLTNLYGLGSLESISKAHVCVVGVGGVGSWCAEALARSGICHMTLVDQDDICVSNVNRQVHALTSSVGKFKVDVLKSRIEDINPYANVTVIYDFLSKLQTEPFVESHPEFDLIIDAIDDVFEKAYLINACVRRKISVISCGAGGGLTDPTLIRVNDLARVTGDNLLSNVRRMLRQKFGYPNGEIKHNLKPSSWRIETVHSLPIGQPRRNTNTCMTTKLRKCDLYYGNAVFCTGTIGFVAASVAVRRIAQRDLLIPKNLFMSKKQPSATTASQIEEKTRDKNDKEGSKEVELI